MRRHFAPLWIATLVMWPAFAARQTPTPSPASPSTARLQTYLPRPMAPEDIALFGQILSLSEAQAMAIQPVFETYCRDYQSVRSKLEPALNAGAVAAAADSVADAVYVDFTEARRQAIERLISLDKGFLESIESFLSEPQRQVLQERVVQQRTRDRCALRPVQCPGSQIDLVRLTLSIREKIGG